MWEGLDDDKVAVIAPSIDAFNAKNQELEEAQVHAILAAAGIVDGGGRRRADLPAAATAARRAWRARPRSTRTCA